MKHQTVACSWRIVAPALALFFAVTGVLADPLVGGGVEEDVFYQFMPIAWRDSDGDTYRFGDFGGMIDSLDYLDNLGITAVWMTPIFPSPAYHGYQHGPADEVNARFGTKAGFLSFVDAAHARGIKVFIDFVVYGISQDTVWFQDSYNNPSSIYDGWLAYYNGGNTQYLGSVYPTWNGDTVGFIHWNLNNTTVTDMVTGWALDWLDPNGDQDPSDGVDGFRLDHVSAYHPTESVWGYDIAWWEAWKLDLLAVNPNVFTFAEQADWGSYGDDLLTAHDASMTKPLLFAARSALANETATGLYSEMLAALASVPAGKHFLGTLGDHDVDRLASAIGTDPQKGKAAAAIHMTQPFPPVIYFGDEIGMLGTKQDYSSDANDIPMREPFKWNAVAGPPMSNYWVLNSQSYNNAFSADNDGRSVEEQSGDPNSLLETYRTLIATRKSRVALRRGSYHEVPASSSRVWAFLRHVADQETLLVAINVHGNGREPTLDLSAVTIPGGSTTVQDVLSGAYLAALTDANKAAYTITLPAYGFLILALDVIPGEPELSVIDGLNIPTDAGAGFLVAVQDNATAMGDNVNEIDQLFVRVDEQSLHVGIPGNLATDGTGMAMFFDTISGGQNVLDTSSFSQPPGGIPQLHGMVLDTGFSPDLIVFTNAWAGTIYVNHYGLQTGGPGPNRYIGAGTVNDLDGYLSGGSNVNGMLLALNNSNTAGVTDSDASQAGTATSGFEATLPFADLFIAEPVGTIKMMAMLVENNGRVGNQFLPGLGGGYGYLGYVPLDLNDIPGQQYALISLSQLPGDWDGDGDVDLLDYAHFADCLTAPDGGPMGPGCSRLDFDTDQDIDLSDFSTFQAAFTGS